MSDKRNLREPLESPVKWTYTRLTRLIQEFEARLDDEHEIGLSIVPLGDAVYRVRDFDCWYPDMLIFYCLTLEGAEATLIQHHSQLNFLLIALPKLDPQEPPRRIGFSLKDAPTIP